jgi:hypothetical protein
MIRCVVGLGITLACDSRTLAQDTSSPPAPPKATGPLPARTWEALDSGKAELPPVKVEPSQLHLGDMLPNTTREGEIRLTNTGATVLTIQQVKSNCTCTVAQPDQKVIQPGGTTTLKASLDASDGIANVVRQVAVVFEGYSKPLMIRVRADVSYGVRTEMRFTPEGQTRAGEIQLRSIDKKPFRVLAVNGGKPVYFKAFDPSKDEPRNEYILRFDLSAFPDDQIPRWLAIETDHASSPIIDVPMRVDDEKEHAPTSWSFKEHRLLAGLLKPGESRELTATMKLHAPGMTSAIDGVRPYGDAAKVEVLGVEPAVKGAAKVRLRITPRADLRGLLYFKFFATCGGQEQEMFVLGRVAE